MNPEFIKFSSTGDGADDKFFTVVERICQSLPLLGHGLKLSLIILLGDTGRQAASQKSSHNPLLERNVTHSFLMDDERRTTR